MCGDVVIDGGEERDDGRQHQASPAEDEALGLAGPGDVGGVVEVAGVDYHPPVQGLNLDGVKSADGEPVLHPEAYYTLNELP